jgi:hypothetical protein
MTLSESDRWLVLSPGRTGGKIIVDCIRNAYRDQGLRLRHIMYEDEVSVIPNLSITHSHRVCNTHHAASGVKVILSTRDAVESAISWCIVHKIGKYHLFPESDQSKIDQLNNKIPSFYLSPKDFYWQYMNVYNFYKNLELSDDITIIDYSEIKDDYTVIYDLLDLPKPANYQRIPIKNPGTPEQWITNWEEISELISKLDRCQLK